MSTCSGWETLGWVVLVFTTQCCKLHCAIDQHYWWLLGACLIGLHTNSADFPRSRTALKSYCWESVDRCWHDVAERYKLLLHRLLSWWCSAFFCCHQYLCWNQVLFLHSNLLGYRILRPYSLPAALRAAHAKCQYLSYSQADFVVFHPAGATRCTDGGEIWHGWGDLSMLNLPPSVQW